MNEQDWLSFEKANNHRRAIRQYTGEPVADDDMRAILSATQLAPSSFNLQPYELHWVRDPELCGKLTEACENQRTATSAATFVVVVAKWKDLPAKYEQFLRHVQTSSDYDERHRNYYLARRKKIRLFVGIARLRVIGWLKALLSVFTRHVTMAPLGHAGLSHWAARNSIFAAQTLLMAASARGIDTCPMEGFSPKKVAKALGIKTGIITLVISLGKRAEDAEINPRWRFPFEQVIKIH